MKSKLAITSFILSLIGSIPIILLPLPLPRTITESLGAVRGTIFSKIFIFIMILIISFILSIISLILIKKNNLEGKKLAWASLIISTVLGLGLLLFIIALMNSGPLF